MRHAIRICLGYGVGLSLALAYPGNDRVDAAAPREASIAAAQDCLRNAVQAAQGIKEEKGKHEILNNIGLAQAYAGDIAGAGETARQIRDAEGAVSVLAVIGLAQGKRDDCAAAKATLAEAVERIPKVTDARVRELLLHFVIDAHLAGGQFSHATRLAATFADHLNRSYAQLAICEAQLAIGRRDEAKRTLDKLTRERQTRRSLDPFDMMLWEKIWPVCLQLGDIAAASKLAHAIPREHFDSCRALRDVAAYQAKAGRTAEAAATFSEAFDAARQIEDRDPWVVRRLHMASVVEAQAKLGHLSEAWRNLERMPNCRNKVEAMGDLAVAEAKVAGKPAARATIERAIAVAGKLEGESRAGALAAVAKSQAEMGERRAAVATAKKAVESVRAIDDSGLDRGIAVVEVAEALAKAGDRESARKWLEEAARRARAESVPEFLEEEARQIVKAQIEMGFRDAAQVTLRDVFLPSVQPRDKDSDGGEEAVLLAKAGDFARAIELAGKVQHPSFQAVALRSVAAYQTVARGPVEPSAAAKKEADPLARSAIYLGIALGLLRGCGIEVRGHYGLSLIDE